MHLISSCGRLIVGDPAAWDLDDGLTNTHLINLTRKDKIRNNVIKQKKNVITLPVPVTVTN